MPDRESSHVRSAQSARSNEGSESTGGEAEGCSQKLAALLEPVPLPSASGKSRVTFPPQTFRVDRAPGTP
jgi:hypothetical protein